MKKFKKTKNLKKRRGIFAYCFNGDIGYAYQTSISYKKANSSQLNDHHEIMRSRALHMLDQPGKTVNDVRLSLTYHTNCRLKNNLGPYYKKSNKELYKMAKDYTNKMKDKPINTENFYDFYNYKA